MNLLADLEETRKLFDQECKRNEENLNYLKKMVSILHCQYSTIFYAHFFFVTYV